MERQACRLELYKLWLGFLEKLVLLILAAVIIPLVMGKVLIPMAVGIVWFILVVILVLVYVVLSLRLRKLCQTLPEGDTKT